MAVDKNLFVHDLAIVAILKNEAPYLREWLDYHLMAGVDHFYLYDNDSTDNQAEVAAPYVEMGLVDYFPAPGKVMQLFVYNDAVKRFKFQSRYMAFIDLDEFIYPKSNQSIVEVVDEILSHDLNAAGLGINWQIFGSNGHETADYSRGVLERFTRRAPINWAAASENEYNYISNNIFIKTIANPRLIDHVDNPHFATYFKEYHSINEEGKTTDGTCNYPITAKKIVVNHYYCKSREEYKATKMERGWACSEEHPYEMKNFEIHDRNEEFDDGILKYRAARADSFSVETAAEKLRRVEKALIETLPKYISGEPIEDKLATALTCRALSTYLREKFPHDIDCWQNFEKASLEAILKSLDDISMTEARLLVLEMPELLSLPYPTVEKLRGACLHIIPQMMSVLHLNNQWREYVELDYIQRLLQKI
ncbi:MAG: glycosyltransferase family 92 protein [Selenomonadaceae bacterium]|nr:glycosyltransferase family 92 protein [Selenomonadaceae bacterium]